MTKDIINRSLLARRWRGYISFRRYIFQSLRQQKAHLLALVRRTVAKIEWSFPI